MQLNFARAVHPFSGLASVHPSSMGVVNSLMKYLKSNAFCRNRRDAALAVGMAACEERNHSGLFLPEATHRIGELTDQGHQTVADLMFQYL